MSDRSRRRLQRAWHTTGELQIGAAYIKELEQALGLVTSEAGFVRDLNVAEMQPIRISQQNQADRTLWPRLYGFSLFIRKPDAEWLEGAFDQVSEWDLIWATTDIIVSVTEIWNDSLNRISWTGDQPGWEIWNQVMDAIDEAYHKGYEYLRIQRIT